MPASPAAQPVYPEPARPVQYATEPASKMLATRAAGVGMFGVLLAAIGIVLGIFIGATAANLALIYALVVGGAIVFVVALVFCIVFTIQRR